MALKVLITGVTGYIGGSVLSTLLDSRQLSKPEISISVLLRGEEKAKLYEAKGLKTFLFNSLDETGLLREVARQHDIAIHTASGFHTSSAIALIRGLADRAKETGNPVHYIHIPGTSNLADQPITGAHQEAEPRVFSDKENIHRTTDIEVVETGLAQGVKTTIIMSPTIYGVGTGLGNRLSIQVPTIMKASLKSGAVDVVGEGKAEWDFVHIMGLADLYELVIYRVVKGEEVPSGEREILFSGTGSSRTNSEVGRELGWQPQKTKEDFKNHFLEEAGLIVAAELSVDSA
ncbi:hypothetical protein F5882DRAFT_383431 [Hyaloscypha sp. PMI_1271]|nr:hypothetical protein F5882DRAFT_383431 [Hyaloscypha sp. PMI_1271]